MIVNCESKHRRQFGRRLEDNSDDDDFVVKKKKKKNNNNNDKNNNNDNNNNNENVDPLKCQVSKKYSIITLRSYPYD